MGTCKHVLICASNTGTQTQDLKWEKRALNLFLSFLSVNMWKRSVHLTVYGFSWWNQQDVHFLSTYIWVLTPSYGMLCTLNLFIWLSVFIYYSLVTLLFISKSIHIYIYILDKKKTSKDKGGKRRKKLTFWVFQVLSHLKQVDWYSAFELRYIWLF